MYEAVTVHPHGRSTVSRMAATAAAYGYDGVVVRGREDRADLAADEVAERFGVDVVAGREIHADDPARASGSLGAMRDPGTPLILEGGPTVVNEFAVRQERVDVLARPMHEGDLNHVLVRAALDNGVRLEVNLARVLRATGGRRVRALADLRKLRELIEDAAAPYVVSADVGSHLQLRAPRELEALGAVLGADPGWIEAGLAEWGRLAAEKRRRTAPDVVEPGVRRGRYGGEDG